MEFKELFQFLLKYYLTSKLSKSQVRRNNQNWKIQEKVKFQIRISHK